MPPWLDSILFLLVTIMLAITYYGHFVMDYDHPADTMVAYVGRDHVRLFERAYAQERAVDLWAFGHRPRKASRIRFENSGIENALHMFDHMHRYSQMLLLYHPKHVPLFAAGTQILSYRMRNDTIGYLFPRYTLQHRHTDSLESVLAASPVDVLQLF